MSDDKIKCAICGMQVHRIETHLAQAHPEVTLEGYQAKFPNSPILSEKALSLIEQHKESIAKKATGATVDVAVSTNYEGLAAFTVSKKAMHEVFKLGNRPEAMSSSTNRPIMITTFDSVGAKEHVPAVDDGYVFDIDDLKNLLIGLEMKIPVYVYGHKGTGKTELVEQVCARTGRPLIRLQHTINTEESHVQGSWAVKKNGDVAETVFNLGPLPEAMLNGWTYLADEYDFAMPSVTAVYQAVLEGKPLFIKDAPPELRLIKPHPNFRIIATGNTNGSGDETGLYSGTNVQNSANYDRFGVMIEKHYMPAKDEVAIIVNRTGLKKDDAEKMVEFGTKIRTAFNDGKIADTVSVRTLINATRLGIARGSFKQGIQLSFANKLSSVDKKVAEDVAARIFA